MLLWHTCRSPFSPLARASPFASITCRRHEASRTVEQKQLVSFTVRDLDFSFFCVNGLYILYKVYITIKIIIIKYVYILYIIMYCLNCIKDNHVASECVTD